MRSPLDVVVGGPNLRRRAADVKRALAPFSAVTGVLSPKCADKAPGGTGGPSPRDTLTRNGGAALDGATRRRFAAPVTRRSDGRAGRAPGSARRRDVDCKLRTLGRARHAARRPARRSA